MSKSTPLAKRSLRLVVPDRPGALAEVTAILADRDIDIIRLEVWPGTDRIAYDDITVQAESASAIDLAMRELRSHGYDTVTLPQHWWLRDWAAEIFTALEQLDRAASRSQELDTVVNTATRLANTSHAMIVSAPAGGHRANHRLAELVETFGPSWIHWGGIDRAVSVAVSAMAASTTGPPSCLEPIDAVHGLAVEIPGPTAASAVLAVVGIRPPFLPAEVARIDRYASLVGRLHPVEPVLAAPL